MRLIKNQKGFTIVETLIVLAVTGFMLMSTIMLVSGQVSRYQFRESSINFEQQLADAINDTRSGYFVPLDAEPAVCNGLNSTNTSAGDSDCVYAGKKITYSPTTRQLIKTSLYMDENINPFINPGAVQELNTTVSSSNLPSGLDYKVPELSFYVMFTRYLDPATSAKSQSQNIEILTKDPVSGIFDRPTNNLAIEAYNGSRQVVYCLGKDGNPSVYKVYQKDIAMACS